MKDIETFEELVEAGATEGTLPDGWIYRESKQADLRSSKFCVTTSDEGRDLDHVVVEGDEIPVIIADKGMRPLLDTATFEDVVSSREEKTAKRDIADIAKAVEYYLENDDFMD